MNRRKSTCRDVCVEDGCRESAYYEFDRVADYRAHARRTAEAPYRCTRHTRPDSVLSDTNREITATATATLADWSTDQLFWHDGTTLGSGFAYGLGFKAFAKDFPEGTRLVITARVELPNGDADDEPATAAPVGD